MILVLKSPSLNFKILDQFYDLKAERLQLSDYTQKLLRLHAILLQNRLSEAGVVAVPDTLHVDKMSCTQWDMVTLTLPGSEKSKVIPT